MDSFVFLFLENYGVRKLEAIFAVLIAMMALSFAWMFADTKPSGKELVIGQKLDSVYACFFILCFCTIQLYSQLNSVSLCRSFGSET